MSKNLTHIVFVLDKSGSMWNLQGDTIGGFNSYLADQKKETESDAIVSCYMFNDNTKTVYKNRDIQNTKELTENDYNPGGNTALYDAIGFAVSETAKINKEVNPLHTVFVIMTDGYENSSHEYSRKAICSLIESKRNDAKWQFIFMGADIEAEDVAEELGMDRRLATTYTRDSVGTRKNFEAAGRITRNTRERSYSYCERDVEEDSAELDDVREYHSKKD